MKRRRSSRCPDDPRQAPRWRCLAGGFVLALMVGPQEGTQQDFGFAFRAGGPRPADLRLPAASACCVFLADHLLAAGRALPAPAGRAARSLPASSPWSSSYDLLNWNDPLQIDGRQVRPAAPAPRPTRGGSRRLAEARSSAGLGWTWLLLVVVVAARCRGDRRAARCSAGSPRRSAVVVGASGPTSPTTTVVQLRRRHRPLARRVPWRCSATWSIAGAGVAAVRSASAEVADTGGFIDRVMGWRPGLPLVVLGRRGRPVRLSSRDLVLPARPRTPTCPRPRRRCSTASRSAP